MQSKPLKTLLWLLALPGEIPGKALRRLFPPTRHGLIPGTRSSPRYSHQVWSSCLKGPCQTQYPRITPGTLQLLYTKVRLPHRCHPRRPEVSPPCDHGMGILHMRPRCVNCDGQFWMLLSDNQKHSELRVPGFSTFYALNSYLTEIIF